jgi:hypothetical protein
MKTLLFSFIIATGFLALSSCEGGTTFTKTIENKSSESITVRVYSIYGAGESVTINANESAQIYWDDQMGFFVDNSYTCTNLIDSIAVSISNNKTLLKDVMNADNWIRESKDGRNSREDCTFAFTDNDLL